MKQSCCTTADQSKLNKQHKHPQPLCEHNSELKLIQSSHQENKKHMHNRDKVIPTKGSNTGQA
jgi:hypothetical protein